MTRVYQELLSVRRDGNEMYLVPVPARLVGMDFVAAASVFLPERTDLKACLLIGIHRGDAMMLNPVGGEAGPLREGDQLILLSHTVPALSGLQPSGVASDGARAATASWSARDRWWTSAGDLRRNRRRHDSRAHLSQRELHFLLSSLTIALRLQR